MNMNVQWTRFPNLLALNNPGEVDMPLKSINQSINLCVCDRVQQKKTLLNAYIRKYEYERTMNAIP